jgi:hypothetical protein
VFNFQHQASSLCRGSGVAHGARRGLPSATLQI